ncbi:nuclear pore complex protein NUP50B-like [Curcuma longa]|uniref:nuclear pore complex protein NUP50B-like n=1 Tax=Curcuma longa TaxID=136217 RepID=UPI003D9E2323
MGDADNGLAPSKKRVAGRQLTKDDHDQDDDAPDMEMGTFKKASEEVMATRRIVKVRRSQPAPAASSNPFAGIRLIASSNASTEAKNSVESSKIDNTAAQQEQDESNENSVVADVNGTEIAVNSDNIGCPEENGENLDKISEPLPDTVDNKKGSPALKEVQSDGTSKAEKIDRDKKTDGESVKEDQQEENEKEAVEIHRGDGGKVENSVEESDKEVEKNDHKDAAAPAAPLSSFQQLSSSQNAFSGLTGTGFSSTSFAFGSSVSGLTGTGFSTSFSVGSLSKEGFSFGSSVGATFSFKDDTKFSLGAGSSPSLGSTTDTSKSLKLSKQETPLETGEENEEAVFTADAIMFEYMDGGWKERGKGELKLNVSVSDTEKARLVMRAKGNFRLILNASLYPDMSLTNMDKRGITFACVNSAADGKDGLTTVAVKFKDSSIVQQFREAVMTHKAKKASTSEPTKDAD